MTDRDLTQRITDYLTGGGLFNPEMANHEAVRDLLIECRDALAQPEQEPVAYMGSAGLGYDKNKYLSIPLYTAPSRKEWVGLTGDDIENLWNGVQWSISDFVIPFTRAIEAKLKEKNGV